ncbi:MAG TPA: thaumatin family protein [Chitinivibrionales bacterium]|jgi:hypothetical protein|nr:thaumatin family protein [Chitinivibrionales bacterium]
MKKVLSAAVLFAVFLLPAAVSADTIFTCPVCAPATADTFPHNNGKYGTGTRHYYMHNYWHKDLTVHVNGNGNGAAWTNLTFTLKMGHDTIIEIPNHWTSARIWGLWDPKYANGPFTLAEISETSGWGCDWYDVSLVDGYNLPMLYYPLPGTFPPDNPHYDSLQGRQGWTCGGEDDCEKDLYLTAPASMLKLDTINGVLDTNGFYCSDDGAGQAACRALKKAACPTSYSFAYDDPHSLFTCPSPNLPGYSGNGPDYILDFGLPPATSVINNNKPTINYTFIGDIAVTMTRHGELKYAYAGGPNARLSLYSCNGKLISEIALTESSGTVRVPATARGMYFVTLTAGDQVKTTRMMVAR